MTHAFVWAASMHVRKYQAIAKVLAFEGKAKGAGVGPPAHLPSMNAYW